MTDADAGETGFRPQPSVAGLYGVFTLDAAGNWTYTLNNANPTVQPSGSAKRSPRSSRSPPSTERPAPSPSPSSAPTTAPSPLTPDTASTDEDKRVAFAVLGNDTDPDSDPLTVTGATVDPAKGSVTVDPNGALHLHPGRQHQ